MHKCLKVTFAGDVTSQFLRNAVQKTAKKYGLEGVAQMIDAKKASVVVCGKKEEVDTFLDEIHKELAIHDFFDIEIEPFLKEKDYRGVFRIIE
jgi:acylphosphatase